MDLSKVLSLIGYSEQEIKVLSESEPTEVEPIIEAFNAKQKANFEKLIDKKSIVGQGKKEAYLKATKTLLNVLGVELEADDLNKDFEALAEIAVDKFKEANKHPVDTDSAKIIEDWQNKFKASQATIKQLEKEKEEIKESAKSMIDTEISNFFTNEQILKLSMKEDKEFVLPREKVVDYFRAQAQIKGLQFKKTDNGIEVLDKEGNPIQRKLEGSKATEFHTLETIWNDETLDLTKKSNGGGGTPNASGLNLDNKNLSPIQKRMLENADKM